MPDTDPIRSPDSDARAVAQGILFGATFGALAVHDAQTGAPSVTRVVIGTDEEGHPVSLISELATHFAALKSDPRCALLLG